jgi:hypothetical protein
METEVTYVTGAATPSDSIEDRRQKPWAMVEAELLRDPYLTPQCKALYGLLITYGPERIFPGHQTLADCMGVSRSSIIRWLGQMHVFGLIEWDRRTGTSNKYYILGYANYKRGVALVEQGCSTSATGGVAPVEHDLDPLIQNQEPEKDPPAADSPPSGDLPWTEPIEGTADNLWPTDRPPTTPTQPRTKEQHQAGVRLALETFEQNGGRPGVADPTQGDPWADKPLKAFCVLVGQDVDQLKESKYRDWPRTLQKWAQTFGHTVTPQEAFQCIQGITQSEFNWMSFTSPRQTTFQETMDIMVGRLRGGKAFDAGINGKRSGNGRHDAATPGHIDPERLRIFEEQLGDRLVT